MHRGRTLNTKFSPLAVTLLACAAYAGLAFVPLPGLPPEVQTLPVPGVLSVGAIGAVPIVSGFILVEIIAALVPALRPLRGTAQGRTQLRRAAHLVALPLALVQIYAVVEELRRARVGDLPAVPSVTPSPLLLTAAALLFGVLMARVLAKLIDVAGVGAGYSLLIASSSSVSVVRALYDMRSDLLENDPLRQFLPLALFFGVALRMLTIAPYAGIHARYRLPLSGLMPVHLRFLLAAVGLRPYLAQTWVRLLLPAGTKTIWPGRALELMIALLLCLLWSKLFHRACADEDRAAWRRALNATAIWIVALFAISWWTVFDASSLNARLFSAVAMVAAVLDLSRELRFRRKGRLRAIRVVHELDTADQLAAVLREAGIDAELRGAHHRALYQFFGPFIPVSVLVAESDVPLAEPVLAAHESRD
jgi:hypothetical protein